jgi:hypothetical protein
MKETTRVALFGHDRCRSKFFLQLNASVDSQYKGKCPNPMCNRHVALFPEVLYTSTDKARREYIKRSQGHIGAIYWQA